VAKRKKKIQEVFIPLDFQLGYQFQFDWGEAILFFRVEPNAFSSSAFSFPPVDYGL
jgi:hypothetical protein